MKLKTFLIVGCLGGFFALNSCTAPTNEKDYSVFVNPFIGTGGHGHTFPGAVVPHGMIQPSPFLSGISDLLYNHNTPIYE